MQAEDRPIHFSTELLHRPAKHPVPTLQKLYYDLSQTKHAAYDSSDFSQAAQPKFHSKRSGKAHSVALFLPDRIVLAEEWVDTTLSQFLEKVGEVAGQAMTTLNIAQFMAHTATIRTTFALTHYDDARVFLLDHACAQEGRISPHFDRPVAVGGLRFVLPETPEHPGNFHLTIESFRHSRNELYVEVKGIFPRKPVNRDEIDTVSDNIRRIRSFINDSVFPYLNQFDTPSEESQA